MKRLIVTKQDKRTGERPKGAYFTAPDGASKVWIALGLVRDMDAVIKPKRKRKKR